MDKWDVATLKLILARIATVIRSMDAEGHSDELLEQAESMLARVIRNAEDALRRAAEVRL
jgi:hypothetical protein